MNWTGGALGRSRNANASTLAVQRRYFAKVRSRQTNKHNLSPIKIFEDIHVPDLGNKVGPEQQDYCHQR